jgi:hypothetical protein
LAVAPPASVMHLPAIPELIAPVRVVPGDAYTSTS